MNKSKELIDLLEQVSPKEAAGILFKHANEVFLVKHAQLKKWVTPGGMKEKSDTDLKTTAHREFREEVGMFPGYLDTAKYCVTEDANRNINYTTYLYEPEHRFEPVGLDEESEMAQWFDIDKLPDDIYPHTKAAIDQFKFSRLVKPRGWK